MCRYGFKTYKPHFACFNCRKTFKQAHFTDFLKTEGKFEVYKKLVHKAVKKLSDDEKRLLDEFNEIKNREIKCPECGNLMADLGLDFKSPKKTAIKEWKIIEGLYTTGKCFYSCGCTGIGFIPKNNNDYYLYLKNTLSQYENSVNHYINKTISDYPDKIERINYWNTRVKLVKSELTTKFHNRRA